VLARAHRAQWQLPVNPCIETLRLEAVPHSYLCQLLIRRETGRVAWSLVFIAATKRNIEQLDYNFAMFLFASWLEGLTFTGRQRRFERDVRKEYSWLFEKFDGRIVPQKRYRRVLDYVVATVAVGDCFFNLSEATATFTST
jgi:hypothetical protein